MEAIVVTLLGMMIGLTGLILLSFLLSIPVWLLWNGCLVGAIAGVNEVTWLQAWGLSILFSFLFKSTNTSKKD